MTISGVDYAYGRPGGAALAKAGVRFAARYLSHTAGKNLTRSEAADLAVHGVSCVVVWETTARRASAGRAAGVADAQDAAAQATAAGMPSSRPIYFAVDYDASPSAVVPYFQGVASVIGVGRTGVYGGYRVVSYLLDHKLATWAWQTVAWSGGRWDARTHIRQYATTVRVNGVSCDKDTAMTADYGQWTPGKAPVVSKEEDSMTVSRTDAQTIWEADVVPAAQPPYNNHDYDEGNRLWRAEYALGVAAECSRAARALAGQALAQAQQNGAALTALTQRVDALAPAPAPEIDYAKLAAALIAAVVPKED